VTDIRLRDLVKSWGADTAVDGASFAVRSGTLTVLLGPSGCGKSTILRLVAGLETPSAGTVEIGGRDVTGQDAADRGIAMVFQSYALFPHLTVRENILFGLKVRKVAKTERESRLAVAAETVGLTEYLHRRPAELSGGQRQRVALARAVIAERRICLMDEPLSNLDAKLRAQMRDEIRALQQRLGLTMIYVTHDQTEAMSMADEIVLLDAGKIVQAGTPEDLYMRPRSAFAARFIGQPPTNLIPRNLLPADEGTGWIGIRPEDIFVGGESLIGGLPATVTSVDYLGAETHLRVDLGGEGLIARIDGRTGLRPGAPVRIGWDAAAAHIFDERGLRQDGLHPSCLRPPGLKAAATNPGGHRVSPIK